MDTETLMHSQTGPYQPTEATEDVRRNSQASWSLVLGLLSLFGLFPFVMIPAAVAGLMLGIRGLASARRGQAVAGVVLSSIGLLIWVLFAVWIARAIHTVGWDQFLSAILATLAEVP